LIYGSRNLPCDTVIPIALRLHAKSCDLFCVAHRDRFYALSPNPQRCFRCFSSPIILVRRNAEGQVVLIAIGSPLYRQMLFSLFSQTVDGAFPFTVCSGQYRP
jgi:hypothetical protein